MNISVRLGNPERWADDPLNYAAARGWYAVYPWEVERSEADGTHVYLFETEEEAHAFAIRAYGL